MTNSSSLPEMAGRTVPPLRLALDTNIWLDWLVFDDPAIIPLKSANSDRLVQIAVNAECLAELGRVLAYPEFELNARTRDALIGEVRHFTCLAETRLRAKLPRCTDPDDQKFLELAHDAQVEWLLTRDKALLGLVRKRNSGVGFNIGTPEQWTFAFESIKPR